MLKIQLKFCSRLGHDFPSFCSIWFLIPNLKLNSIITYLLDACFGSSIWFPLQHLVALGSLPLKMENGENERRRRSGFWRIKKIRVSTLFIPSTFSKFHFSPSFIYFISILIPIHLFLVFSFSIFFYNPFSHILDSYIFFVSTNLFILPILALYNLVL